MRSVEYLESLKISHVYVHIVHSRANTEGKRQSPTKTLLLSIDPQVPQVAEQINIRKRRDEGRIKGPHSAPLIPFNGHWQLTVPFFVLFSGRSQVRRFRISRTQNTPNRDTRSRKKAGDEQLEDLSSRKVTKNDIHTSCLNCEKHSRRRKILRHVRPGQPIPGQNVSKTWARSVTNRSPDRSRFPPRLTRRLFVSRETKFRPFLCPLTYVVHTSGPIVIIASSLLTRSLA